MAGGRQYFDVVTIEGRDAAIPFAIVRPAALANDPANSIYTNWADAYDALAGDVAPLKQIFIDSGGVAVLIPVRVGGWNMRGIAIVGLQASDLGVLGRQLIITQDGCTFLDWTEGCENCSLVHNSNTSPLVTSTIALPNLFTMRTGKNAIWAASGLFPVVFLNGTGGLRVAIEEGSIILGTPFSPVLALTAAGGEYELVCYPNFGITDLALAGPVGTTINVWVMGPYGTELSPTQPLFFGTLAVFGGASNLAWPDGPTNVNFVPPGPSSTGDALIRIAAAVAGLLGGPIP